MDTLHHAIRISDDAIGPHPRQKDKSRTELTRQEELTDFLFSSCHWCNQQSPFLSAAILSRDIRANQAIPPECDKKQK